MSRVGRWVALFGSIAAAVPVLLLWDDGLLPESLEFIMCAYGGAFFTFSIPVVMAGYMKGRGMSPEERVTQSRKAMKALFGGSTDLHE